MQGCKSTNLLTTAFVWTRVQTKNTQLNNFLVFSFDMYFSQLYYFLDVCPRRFVLSWTTMTKLFDSFVNVCKSTDTNKQFETCFPICLICVTKFSQTCQLRKNYYKWSYPFPTEVPIYGIIVFGHTISRKRTLRKGTDHGISLNGMSKVRKPKCMTPQT